MALTDKFDTVFDEEGDSDVLEEKQWRKLREDRIKDGYRAGLQEGQDLLLQEGFNKGFQQACLAAYEVAKLRGIMSALMSHHLSHGDQLVDGSTVEQLQHLLEEVWHVEQECLDAHKKESGSIQPADSHSKDSESTQPADNCSKDIGSAQPADNCSKDIGSAQLTDSHSKDSNSETCCQRGSATGEICAGKQATMTQNTPELKRLKICCMEILSRLNLQIHV